MWRSMYKIGHSVTTGIYNSASGPSTKTRVLTTAAIALRQPSDSAVVPPTEGYSSLMQY